MTELETENEELQESFKQARREQMIAEGQAFSAEATAEVLTKVVSDMCKGHEPTDVMWVKIQKPRP